MERKKSVAGIVYSDSLILIGKRLPTGSMASKWEFPGGKVEPDENCKEALIREFKEEFSIDIEVGEKIAEAEFTHKGIVSDLFAYRVYFLNENPTWVLSEHEKIKWATIEEIKSLDFVDSDLLLIQQIEKKLAHEK
jgi:8-oxo-dGTP diphosphatase